MRKEIGEVDLAQCFYFAAMTLCGDAFDKLNNNAKSPEELLPSEYCHGNVIVAFYLYRHALEIQMKKLMMALKLGASEKLDISTSWQLILQNKAVDHICGVEEIKTNLNRALEVLARYKLSNLEELFDTELLTKEGNKGYHYKSINQRDCESLLLAYYDVRYLLLCIEEIRFCAKSTHSLLYELENSVFDAD